MREPYYKCDECPVTAHAAVITRHQRLSGHQRQQTLPGSRPAPTEKWCPKCATIKPLGDFAKLKSGRAHGQCRLCSSIGVRAWRQANPLKAHMASRRCELDRKYGMTHEDYERMVDEQGGRCAICGGPPTRTTGRIKRFHIDHDHATGEVRGLLCISCNRTVGYVERFLGALLAYLGKDTSSTV